MRTYWICDEEKRPIPCYDLMKWGTWYETADRHIGKTTVGDSLVSTVFLSIDYSFGGGAPVLYETMVFGGALDGECVRYYTLEEAQAGHEAMVQRVSEAQP